MALSDFLNGCTSVSLYLRCSLCSNSVHAAQKNVTCCTKKCWVLYKKMLPVAQKTVVSTEKDTSHRSCIAHQNYVSHKKYVVAPKTETHVD